MISYGKCSRTNIPRIIGRRITIGFRPEYRDLVAQVLQDCSNKGVANEEKTR